MPDGTLSIGARFDKTQLEAGLTSAQEVVESASNAFATVGESSQKKIRDAIASTSQALKNYGSQVTQVSLDAAAGYMKIREAQQAVRNASTLLNKGLVDEKAGITGLAAAQTELNVVTAETAAATKAAAEAQTIAAREAELSSNVIVAALQRTTLAAREASAAMGAEVKGALASFQTGGLVGGLSNLSGSLLGVGIAVGFAVNEVNGLAKMNIELDHLHEETGIGITDLAGLQEIAKEMGADWDPIATGLTRMNKNLNDSIPPTKQLKQALEGVGLTFEEFQGLTPEEKLQKIATAFANTTNDANRTAAAYALFGRGGVALIPILKEQGDQLEANMKKMGALTGVTEESDEAARRWTRDVARLTAELRAVAMPVMEHLEDAVMGVVGVFDTAAATILSSLEVVATGILSLFEPLVHLGILVKDVFTGNWGAIKGDVTAGMNSFVDVWKAGFYEIKNNWAVVVQDFTGIGDDAMMGITAKLSRSDLAAKAPLGAPWGDSGDAGASGGGGGAGGGGAAQAGGGAATGQAIWLQRLSVIPDDLKQQASQIQGMVEPAWKQLDLTAGKTVNDQIADLRQLFAAMGQTPKVVQQMQAPWKRFEMDVKKVFAEIEQDMKKAFKKMTAEFNADIAHWVITGKGFQVSMMQIYRQMLESLTETLLQMGEKWLAHEIVVRVQHLLTATINKSTDAAAAAVSRAATSAANVGNAISNVAVAATGAMASQASIPIVGPALAAAAAAAMEGLGAGFVAAAAFDSGGILPHLGFGYNMSGQPERVLSPSQTRTFESLVNNTQNSSTRAARLHQTNNFGGGVTPEMLKAHTNQTMQRLRSMLRPEAFR